MTKTIDKRADPAIRHLRRVRDGEDPERVFCEGFRLVEELLKSGWAPLEAYATRETEARARELLARHDHGATPLRVLSDSVMAFASGVDSPPGVIAIARKRRPSVTTKGVPLILVLHGLQLPQNVGAIIRSAEAAGVSEVYVTRTTADPFNPKALRGSSGSAFRLPIHPPATLAEVAGLLKSRGIRLLAATQEGADPHDSMDWTGPAALVVASEGAGFSDADIGFFDRTIRIPMAGAVESLNVASAAAVCLFEAARQRRAANGKG
jgi:RNA methyltransferase, TrmH family